MIFRNSSHSARTRFMCLSNASIWPMRLRPSFLAGERVKGQMVETAVSSSNSRARFTRGRKSEAGRRADAQGDLEPVVDERHHLAAFGLSVSDCGQAGARARGGVRMGKADGLGGRAADDAPGWRGGAGSASRASEKDAAAGSGKDVSQAGRGGTSQPVEVGTDHLWRTGRTKEREKRDEGRGAGR